MKISDGETLHIQKHILRGRPSLKLVYNVIRLQTVDGLPDLHFSGGHWEIVKERQLLRRSARR